jgi:hypothetical protein
MAYSSPESLVNQTTSNAQFDNAVAALEDGGWVVTWTAWNAGI